MSTREPKIFDRVFTNRQLLHGRALRAGLWSLGATLATVALLLVAFWTLELCLVVGEGHPVRISVADYEKFFGETPTVTHDGKEVELGEGFAQVAWRSRRQPWGPFLAWTSRRFGIGYGLGPQLSCLSLIVVGSFWWVVAWLCTRFARRQRNHIELEVGGQLRTHLHRQSLRLGPSDLQRTDMVHVIELFKDDIGQVLAALEQWLLAWTIEPVRILLLAILAVLIDPTISFYCGVPLLLCWLISEHRRRELAIANKLAVAHTQDELRLLSESLTRSRLVRGYGMEHVAHEHFKKYLDRYQADATRIEKRRGARVRLEGIIIWFFAVIVVALFGVFLTTRTEHFSFAAATILLVCFYGIGRGIRQFQTAYESREATIPATMRVFRYLDRIPEVGQAVGAKFLEPLTRTIEFLNVVYAASDKTPLLDQLCLSITAMRQVAIISTDARAAIALTSMLPRFVDPQSGQVLIDGEDIAWVTLESLREEALFAGGPEVVFTGTVLENIAAGQSRYTIAEIMDAAKLAHAQHFIQRLPQGYETMIGEHGEALDHGQAFRLSLARAILRDPALLIIEEPAEGLDDDTKALLDDAYQRIANGRTVLFLPSRLSTLRRCDEIILLHQGRIAARGTHAQLVSNSELYRHWQYVRFNEYRHMVES